MKKDTIFGTILSAAIVMTSGLALAQGTTGTPGAAPSGQTQTAPATPGGDSSMGAQQGSGSMDTQQGSGTMGAQQGSGTMGTQQGADTMSTQPGAGAVDTQAAMSPPEDVVGKNIVNAQGDEIGEITGIDGNQLIVEVGGFLGIGAREVAVDWSRIQQTGAGDQMELQSSLTKEELEAMPEHQK